MRAQKESVFAKEWAENANGWSIPGPNRGRGNRPADNELLDFRKPNGKEIYGIDDRESCRRGMFHEALIVPKENSGICVVACVPAEMGELNSY